jgi:hypothetical protein
MAPCCIISQNSMCVILKTKSRPCGKHNVMKTYGCCGRGGGVSG